MGKISINMESVRSYDKINRIRIKEGGNVVRILPPFGDPEIHNNFPYHKWSIVWLTNPKTGKRQPYGSPINNGADQKCPVNDFSKALATAIDRHKAQLTAQGASDKEIKEALKGMSAAQWDLKLSHVYAYNAAQKDGSVGLLEVKSTVHKGIKKAMGKYIQDYGQDPTSLNSDIKDDAGVWLYIHRTGMDRNTEYEVRFNELRVKTADGKISREDDRSPLSQEIVDGYQDLAYDLHSLYKVYSYDELLNVLLANIEMLAEQYPELATCVPGFEVGEPAVEEEIAEELPKTKPVKSASAKVNLVLGDDEDDDDDTPFEVETKPVVKKQMSKSIKDLTDELLR